MIESTAGVLRCAFFAALFRPGSFAYGRRMGQEGRPSARGVSWASFGRACAVLHPGGRWRFRYRCRYGHVGRKCSGIRSVPRLGATRRSWHRVGDRPDNDWSSLASCRCDFGNDCVAGRAGAPDCSDLRRRWRRQLANSASSPGRRRRTGRTRHSTRGSR